MREYFRQPDQFPTVTVLISAPVTVAGQTWRCTVPLLGMTFDQRTDQDALISAVIAAAFGGAELPAGVTCRLLADANKADYTSGFDARQTPLGSICFELQFSADFVGMTDVPLVFTVAGLATDAPANSDITLPVLPTNETDLELKDFQGGTLPGGFHSSVVLELSDGKSAYQIAVDNGFVGDEADWLASLQGDDGAAGAAGTNGTNGKDGADGADGADGQGVPTGGSSGQVLAKLSGADYATAWVDQTGGGGGGHEIVVDGVPLPQRSKLSFTGVTAEDDEVGNTTKLAVLGGSCGGTLNKVNKIVFSGAPEALQVSLTIGAGIDPVTINGNISAEDLKTALEACDDIAGYEIQIAGSTEESIDPASREKIYSGVYFVVLEGDKPYPEWGMAISPEVHVFTVGESGDGGDYSLNGGASFTLSTISDAGLQANQRALGGKYSGVVVKGRASGDSIDMTQQLGSYTKSSGWTNDANMFDGDPTTFCQTPYGDYSSYWVMWDFGEEVDIHSIVIDGDGGNFGFETRLSNDDFATHTRALPRPTWNNGRETITVVLPEENRTFRKVRFLPGNGGKIHQIKIMSVPGVYSAKFHSYFPLGVQDILPPVATGTDSGSDVIKVAGSESALITRSNATLEEMVLINLLGKGEETSDAFTPNPSHWNSPLPETIEQAVNRMAAKFYDWFYEPI